jgi:hypothetical protein
MAYYDIGEVFQKIEEDMIASMARNLKRHLNTEKEEGLNYAMWQAEQLAALNEFKRKNKSLFGRYFSTINGQIEEILRKAHETGKMDQEIQILEAIKKGWSTALKSSGTMQGAFFRINDRKLNALIDSVKNDMKKAETAMLRRTDDEYRKIIWNSQAYYNTGAGTLPQCVDMATKDFLSRGITCIEYANGARVGIDTYSRMALRTAQTRAYLLGESAKRDEWGVSTVIVNKRGVACPRCLRYVGRVFYDDVWGSAPIPSPEKYPRLSVAIDGGLYHPNCRDIHTTYFEGISTPPDPMTDEEKKEASRVYNLEQQQRYNERQIRKYKRLSDGSVDPENRDRYYKKLSEWQDTQRKFVKANGDVLKRRYENESIHGIGPIDNADTRKTVESMRREVELEKQRLSKNSGNLLTNSAKSDMIESTSGAALDNFNRKASVTDFSDDLSKTNPNWSTQEAQWQNNCQRCVPTYEMRRRGFNVTAKPQPEADVRNDYLAMNPWKVWNNPKLQQFNGKNDIETAMAAMGDGARVQVKIAFNNGQGHTFVAEQMDGKTVFLDPQTGKECSNYFDDKATSYGWNNLFWRIDDQEPSDYILDCCS